MVSVNRNRRDGRFLVPRPPGVLGVAPSKTRESGAMTKRGSSRFRTLPPLRTWLTLGLVATRLTPPASDLENRQFPARRGKTFRAHVKTPISNDADLASTRGDANFPWGQQPPGSCRETARPAQGGGLTTCHGVTTCHGDTYCSPPLQLQPSHTY